MLAERFVPLAVLAIGLVVTGFVARGFLRAALGGATGDALAAPLIGLGFLLIVVLTVASVLAYLGVGPLAGALSDND